MKIFAVEDEPMLLKHLAGLIKEVIPEAEVSAFDNPDDAVAALGDDLDVAFLDIEIGHMNGTELAKHIKTVSPQCDIVFCTGYDHYAVQAFHLGASDYLIKPITKEKVEHAVSLLRHTAPVKTTDSDGLYIRCFGEFEVFHNGEPLVALTKRSKELLAYLVDKAGAVCNTNDIINALFYDTVDSYFRIAKKDLVTALTSVGEEAILIIEWGKLGIRKEMIRCDYFDYLDNDPAVINLYKGAYMQQYDWARRTMHRLNAATV